MMTTGWDTDINTGVQDAAALPARSARRGGVSSETLLLLLLLYILYKQEADIEVLAALAYILI